MTAPMCRLPNRRRASRGPLCEPRPREKEMDLRWNWRMACCSIASVIHMAVWGGEACRLEGRRRQAGIVMVEEPAGALGLAVESRG